MTIPMMVVDVVNTFVGEHGTEKVMTRVQLYELVNKTHPVNYSSFMPYDYCYNRTNNGIRFADHPHVFEYIGKNQYRLLGTEYPYTGNIIHKPAETGRKEYVVGRMEKGLIVESSLAGQ